MRKLIKKEIFLGFFFLILGSQFYRSFNFNKRVEWNLNHLLVDPTLIEIQDTYLKLFNEYKKSKLYTDIYPPQKSISSFVLRRDPFKIKRNRSNKHISTPKSNTSTNQNRFNLNGILWDKESPLAVIDNKIVHVGSRIGSFKVLRILPQKVILTSGENTLVLRMHSNRFGNH